MQSNLAGTTPKSDTKMYVFVSDLLVLIPIVPVFQVSKSMYTDFFLLTIFTMFGIIFYYFMSILRYLDYLSTR